MSDTPSYIDKVQDRLIKSLCLHSFPCQKVERQIKPEIEVRTCPELILDPVRIIEDNGNEECLIEQSINSTRISFKFKVHDPLEHNLLDTYLRFMMHRAEEFDIVRRVPLEAYDLSFLLTDAHVQKYTREKLVDFIVEFVGSLKRKMAEMKMDIQKRQDAIVDEWWVTAEAWLQSKMLEEKQQQLTLEGNGDS